MNYYVINKIFYAFCFLIFLIIIIGCQNNGKLIKSVKDGDYENVKKLIKQGVNLNEKDDTGMTPLMIAVYNGNYEIAKLLINNGADINAINTINYMSVLNWALNSKNIDLMKFLIKKGAMPHGIKSYQDLFILLAAQDNLELMKYILNDKKIDINNIGNDGYTALYVASDNNVVSFLIKNGADVNLCDKYSGESPLMSVLRTGKKDLVSLVLENGAIINREDNKGNTVFTILADWCNDSNREELLKVLLKYGGNINYVSKRNETVLDHVIKENYCKAILDVFRKYGAKTSDELKKSATRSKAGK